MTKEEKLSVLQHNVTMAIDRLEDSLRHNIGQENVAFFIDPIRQTIKNMKEDLTK